jgi:prevent-host-death family protein
MKLSDSVKSISYLKAHASEILKGVTRHQQTLVITQNGEAKAVLQDIKKYEETQESLALLKMLSLSTRSKEKKQYRSLEDSFADIRKEITDRESQ